MGQKHGDGLMNQTLTILIVVAVGAIIGLTMYFIQTGYSLQALLTSLPERIGAIYYSIPEAIRVFVPAAATLISTGFAAFFAWAKTLWQKKAKETEQTFQQQITQVEGEKALMEQQLQNSSAAGLEKLIQERDAAVASRDEATALVGQLQSKVTSLEKGYATIDHSLQTVRSPTVPEMKRRLEQEGFTVKPKIA